MRRPTHGLDDILPSPEARARTTIGPMVHRPSGVASAVVVALLVAACASGAGPSRPDPSRGAVETASARPSSIPTATASPTLDLQAMLDRERAMYRAPGALAVAHLAGERIRATSGTADTAGGPISQTTRFRIASITKPIVATLVLDAVARDLVALDDVVGELLPGVLRPSPPVTLRQLLDHTSGIFDETNGGDVRDVEMLSGPFREQAAALLARYEAGERVVIPATLLVALSETHDRYFAPGTDYHYSNVNYQLAAMVLEKITGTAIDALLREKVLDPLGLTRTSLAPPDTSTPEFHGYGTAMADGSLVDLTDDLTFFGNGASGGMISTADELLTIVQAIGSGRLLPPALATAQRTAHLESYGLGLATYRFTCGRFLGHEGGVNGTASIAITSWDGSEGVVVALNLRSGGDPRLPALADSILCTR